MAKNLVNGTNIIIEESGDNINLNLSSTYTSELEQTINNAIKEVYSTEEVKTNKVWIDNKPIYRKVIQDTTSSSTVTWKTIFKGNIKSVISYSGELYFSNTETKLIPHTIPNGTIWFQYTKNGDLQVAHNNESFNNKSFTLTILYTKTTDSGITN